MNFLRYPLRTLVLTVTALLMLHCTDEQQALGLQAEQQYVNLLHAVHFQQPKASVAAVRDFDLTIRQLRQQWYRPMTTDAVDRVLYHIDMAECAYEDARNSIEDGDLVLAAVQLDRAVYELSVGDPASFNELYVASIYDFVASWLAVDYMISHTDELFDWEEIEDCGLDAREVWQDVKHIQPSAQFYPGIKSDPLPFRAAHDRLTKELQAFRRDAGERSPAQVKIRVERVSEALWDLLFLFGPDEEFRI
ncbi:hypothetical protein GGR28_001712 [Lewinella aquimaris]|uniref:Uncharacterized protein n=1 Tax=Neolewinella aquimaris TaxID=1835722 RepID=A0A840E649_9BACT|nr:hypothetical protein [Neolewinella aquimaris]MBB4079095.1 hypothetical protein [Neolewinella aquimaris]